MFPETGSGFLVLYYCFIIFFFFTGTGFCFVICFICFPKESKRSNPSERNLSLTLSTELSSSSSSTEGWESAVSQEISSTPSSTPSPVWSYIDLHEESESTHQVITEHLSRDVRAAVESNSGSAPWPRNSNSRSLLRGTDELGSIMVPICDKCGTSWNSEMNDPPPPYEEFQPPTYSTVACNETAENTTVNP